jgi:PAT family beta-lactamase induction signal transducer AmpG
MQPGPKISPKLLLIMTVLGFSSGLPLALSGFTLRMWLSTEHLGLGVIGLTANIGLSYSLKFLWAPIFDELAPPFPLHRLGRRRGWLLLTQILLILTIAALGLSNPVIRILPTLIIGAFLAFFSASQDILIDAWRIETFPLRQQGTALAGYVWGYRGALLISGAGVIAWSKYIGWHEAILFMAGLALLGPLATLFTVEPKPAPHTIPKGFAARFADAVRAPMAEFLSRRGAAVIIAFIILFRLGDRVAIAIANGPISLAATLLGAALGGLLVARIGVGRALLVTALFQTAALLMYPALGLFPHHPHMLVLTAVLESYSEGFADAAFLTYLSGLCNTAYTATQYALLSSLAPLALRTIGGLSGFIAAATGFIPFFIITAFAALPAMALMLVILKYYPPADNRRTVPA